jgi:hypothetical protein
VTAHIDFHRWQDFAFDEHATWTSPDHRIGFGATQLVASWNATTPAGTWLEVELCATTDTGHRTAWYVLGRWASGDTDIRRTSVPGQADADGAVNVDTFQATRTVHAYRLRVTLHQTADARPELRMVGAMASAIPDRFTVPAGPPSGADAITLPVPAYSQYDHDGGEAWCSPTSTAMVVDYWRGSPSSVDAAARGTYDHAYGGTGNWPFNTAYAATHGLDAHVTRLRSLAELESWVRRGVPVITSQSFLARELTGARYDTAGHLMVVVGFTEAGDVVVNDPAAPGVRTVYQRHQFETVWLRTRRHLADGSVGGGTGGVGYLIAPPGR